MQTIYQQMISSPQAGIQGSISPKQFNLLFVLTDITSAISFPRLLEIGTLRFAAECIEDSITILKV